MISFVSGVLKPVLPVESQCIYANNLLNTFLSIDICISLSTVIDRMMTTSIILYREVIKRNVPLNGLPVTHHERYKLGRETFCGRYVYCLFSLSDIQMGKIF